MIRQGNAKSPRRGFLPVRLQRGGVGGGGGGSLTITGITLSGSSFTGGASSGTVVGSIGVTTTGGSFSGALSLTGADASSFQIVGTNLETNGVVAAGSYAINIVATQGGAVGSPFTQPETITGSSGPVTITGVSLSNNSFLGGSSSGTVVGNFSVTTTGGSFTGAVTITGADAASFQIVGNALQTSGTVATGTYSINLVATQSGAIGSPFTQPETITGSSSSAVITAASYATTAESGQYMCIGLGWTGSAPGSAAATWSGGGGAATVATGSFSVVGPFASFWCSTPASAGTYNLAVTTNNGGAVTITGIVIAAAVPDFSPGIYGPSTVMLGQGAPSHNNFSDNLPIATYFYRGPGIPTATLSDTVSSSGDSVWFVLNPANASPQGRNNMAFALCISGGTTWPNQATFQVTITISNGFSTPLHIDITIQNPATPYVAVDSYANSARYGVSGITFGGNLVLDTAVTYSGSFVALLQILPVGTGALTFTADSPHGYFSYDAGQSAIQILQSDLIPANFGHYTVQVQATGGPVQTVDLWIGHDAPPVVAFVPPSPWNLYSSTPPTNGYGSNQIGQFAAWADSHGGIISTGNMLRVVNSDSSGALICYNRDGEMYLTAPVGVGTINASVTVTSTSAKSTTMTLALPVKAGTTLSASNMSGSVTGGLTNFLTTANMLTPTGSPTTVIGLTVSGFSNPIDWTTPGTSVASPIIDIIQDVANGILDNAQILNGGNLNFNTGPITKRYAISGSGASGTVTAVNLSAKDPSTSYTDNVRITLSDGLGTYCTQTFAVTVAWHTAPSGEVQIGPSSALWPSPTFATADLFSAAYWGNPANYAGVKVRLLRGAAAAGDWLYWGGGHPFASGWYPGPVHFFGDDSTQATFTGTISGTTLTISGVSGTVVAGDVIKTGAATGTLITGGSGSSWTVLPSQSVGPVSMTTRMLRVVMNFANTSPSPEGRGWVFSGGYDVSLKDMEVCFVTPNNSDPGNADGAAAIYHVGNHPGNTSMSGMYIHDSIAGFLNLCPGNHLWIDKCLIVHNGNYSGQLHGIYAGEGAELTITNSWFGDTRAGHDIKFRTMKATISDTVIATGMNGLPNTNIDCCEGGFVRMSRCTIVSKTNVFGGEHNSIIIALQSEIESGDVPWTWDVNDVLIEDCTICSAMPQRPPFQDPAGVAQWSFQIAGLTGYHAGDPQRGKLFNNALVNPAFWNLPSGQRVRGNAGVPTITGATTTATFPWTAIQIQDPMLAVGVPPFSLPLSGAVNYNSNNGSIASPAGTYRMMMVVPSGSGNGTNVTDGLLAAIDAHGAAMTSVTYGTWSTGGTVDNASFTFTTASNKVQLSTVGLLADGLYLVTPNGSGTGYNPYDGSPFEVQAALFVLVGNYV